MYRFLLNNSCKLVGNLRLLRHFFRRIPVRCGCQGWEVKLLVCDKYRHHRLRRCWKYKVTVGALTPQVNKRKGQKPLLILYADKITPCGC
jgi:hypothetical protein